jgi:RNA polymerase sigma-70 factor (ECF subfamily)
VGPVSTTTNRYLADLVSRVADGDEEGLRLLYERTQARIFGIVLAILDDRNQAEDVLVEVYTQAWRQAARFDQTRGSAEVWLATIARTRAIDQRRALRARRMQPFDLEWFETWACDRSSPLDESQGNEEASRVRTALAALPPEQRRALMTAFYGGLSHSEVASVLEQPLGTVKTRIRSGLIALRQALDERGNEVA